MFTVEAFIPEALFNPEFTLKEVEETFETKKDFKKWIKNVKPTLHLILNHPDGKMEYFKNDGKKWFKYVEM